MSDRLVTIATFQDPVPATLAKNYLEDQGIPAILLDETTIATDWMLSSAIGGVKLQVAQIHVERAELLLNQVQNEKSAEDAPPEPESAIAAQEIAEDLQADREDRAEINKHADKLLFSAVFGLVFWPLQLYAIYLMLAILGTEGKVSPNRRWKVWASIALNMPIMALLLVPLFFIFNNWPSSPEGPGNPVWRRRHVNEFGFSVRLPHEPSFVRGKLGGLDVYDWSAEAHTRLYRVTYVPGWHPKRAGPVEAAFAHAVAERIGPGGILKKNEPLELDGCPGREVWIGRKVEDERSQFFLRGESLFIVSVFGSEAEVLSDEAAQFFRSLRLK